MSSLFCGMLASRDIGKIFGLTLTKAIGHTLHAKTEIIGDNQRRLLIRVVARFLRLVESL